MFAKLTPMGWEAHVCSVSPWGCLCVRHCARLEDGEEKGRPSLLCTQDTQRIVGKSKWARPGKSQGQVFSLVREAPVKKGLNEGKGLVL